MTENVEVLRDLISRMHQQKALNRTWLQKLLASVHERMTKGPVVPGEMPEE